MLKGSMNPGKELAKRREGYRSEMAGLAYERYVLCKQIDDAEERIIVIDRLIADDEVALRENDHARRDFDTYVAIQQSAVTMDDVLEAANTGSNLETPHGAIVESSNSEGKGEDNA